MSNRSSRFAQELISTLLFTVAVGLMWYDFFFTGSVVVDCFLIHITILGFTFDYISDKQHIDMFVEEKRGCICFSTFFLMQSVES